MATWDDVVRIAATLPGAEESTSYRQPCFKVRGKTIVNLSPHEPGALVVRLTRDEAALLIDERPGLYFTTPHYAGYDAVLLRLELADEATLAGRLEDAWSFVSEQLGGRAAI